MSLYNLHAVDWASKSQTYLLALKGFAHNITNKNRPKYLYCQKNCTYF